MEAVLERIAPQQSRGVVRDAVARMQAATRLFTQQEWDELAAYDGPILAGDPDGRVPDNLETDDDD